MKIVKILGGIGNQMFQYALYISLKEKFPQEKIFVDTSFYKTYHVHTGLELGRVFGVELPEAKFSDLLKVTRPVPSFKLSRFLRKVLPPRNTECLEAVDYTFNDSVFTEGNRYYDGYWQNYLYFKDYGDLIRKTFQFILPLSLPNQKVLDKIKLSESVSLHVRRGDYLKAKNYVGLCGIDYYQNAISYINEHVQNPTFFLFSDDIEWCKQHISPLLDGHLIEYVDWNKGKDSPIDMQLMSNCKHNIVANSSFSWWASFLNANSSKIVCAPLKWTNTKVNTKFQMPDWVLF